MSDVTRERDETLKRELYERRGVREYWTIDPHEDVVVVRRFGWTLLIDDLLAR